jgi:hypothetical protein
MDLIEIEQCPRLGEAGTQFDQESRATGRGG